MPCVTVHGSQLGDGQIGPVAGNIVKAWNDLVGLDFIAQAKEYLQEMGADGLESFPSLSA